MKKDSENQLFFDFDAPPQPVPVAPAPEVVAEIAEEVQTPVLQIEPEPVLKEKPEGLSEHELYQAVLAHLVKQGAASAALHVPCRQRKFKTPVAAYFSEY